MQPAGISLSFLLLVVLETSNFQSCVARDTITSNSLLPDDGTTIISAGKGFELGFFDPEDNINTGRYVGIWYYNLSPRTVVWVANRDAPLPYVPGNFSIGEDGNLKLVDKMGTSYFNTTLERSSPVNRILKLLDSGNLVLIDGSSGNILWQSFAEPTDTFLPGMTMDGGLKLVSWMDIGNPATGSFTFEQDQENRLPKIMKGKTAPHWKSDQSGSVELPYFVAFFLSNFSRSVDQATYKSSSAYSSKNPGSANTSLNYSDELESYANTRLLMNSSGEIQFYRWEQDGWSLMWKEPHDACSVYNPCGNYGSCNLKSGGLNCDILPGFKPVFPDAWKTGDFSGGCERKLDICNMPSKPDTFLNLKLMKVRKPDILYAADREDTCRQEYCLSGCACQAYYYAGFDNRSRNNGDGMVRSLGRDRDDSAESSPSRPLPIRYRDETIEYVDGGHNLSIRVPVSAIGKVFCITLFCLAEGTSSKRENPPISGNRVTVIIVTTVIAVVLLAGTLTCSFYRRIIAKRKETEKSIPGNPMPYLDDSERQAAEMVDEDDKFIDVPYFSLESILAATNNFSDTNKLGRGGFGPVYKGIFPEEKEIAVKRLSSHSGQGMEEFRNEVVLIAKLQHRNLVRLLGYCIKGPEKILLYEYMPNKSLDTFIFDEGRCILLDWNMRFNIILGIARGLLYLHQDSRLRIIHRDLKTSNILLDEEMNPKISDFGLARIVQGKETEANTIKVVGTYGYMSPEYAIEGLFSVKSDVFSFGVIILEIVSGKRNTSGFYRSEEVLSLLGYAWRLWQERKALDLVDKKLLESCNGTEVMKSINIGLLCVQDDPSDRPTMSNVLIMLSSETTTLPSPNQPAFVGRRRTSSTSASLSSKAETISINEMTISAEDGR
nr:G-type lectin S-receptor-like serine/threonine-protein kinase At4g03230 [Coffea arabica]